MSSYERNIWSRLIGTTVTVVVYPVLLFSFGFFTPGWLWAMMWALGAGVAVAVVVSTAWNAGGSRAGAARSHRARSSAGPSA